MPLLSVRNLGLEDHPEPLNLELAPGMQALCIVSDDQELRRLLLCCTGAMLPGHGELLLNGVDIASLSRQQLLDQRRQMGIVTANGGLIANLKLWENITLPLSYHYGEVSAEAEQQALELLASLGYRGNLFALPGHLTLFERRVAAFVRAAITAPRLMLYAGCFDNLTAEQRRLLFAQAQLLRQSIPGLSALYLTTSSSTLDELHPDITLNLKHHATSSERSA